ncbi:hypothetical protein AYI69_g10173, partial [Smittium culicis]
MKDNRADGSLWYTTRDEFKDGVATFCVSDSNDKRRFDKNTEYINNYTVIGSQIQSIQEDDRIINRLNSIDYIANVRTRYKKASEKTKPVAERSINYKTPVIITRHTNDDKSEYRLTDENISKIKIGAGNFTHSEQKYFRSVLKKYDKAFAFKSEDLDDGIIKGCAIDDKIIHENGVRNFVMDHINVVEQILITIIDAGLTINGEKCSFCVPEVE